MYLLIYLSEDFPFFILKEFLSHLFFNKLIKYKIMH